MSKNKYLAVIGCGYWGINLVRNFNKIGVLRSVADPDQSSKQNIEAISSNISFENNYVTVLADTLFQLKAVFSFSMVTYS